MSAADLVSLPDRVRESARVEPSGEVSWPIDAAEAALGALADASFVILGLDVRRFDVDGGVWETAWSSFQPGGDRDDDVRAGLDAALEALRRPDIDDFGGWVLVTWQ